MKQKKKVVSFSLWGDKEEYLAGALRALASAKERYPGWEYWFYVRDDVPHGAVADLERLSARVIRSDFQQPYSGMILRFLPASDPEVEVFISRDADSEITEREALAVQAWLASDKAVHIIRDHPEHILPMMGGMWGCRGDLLAGMKDELEKYGKFYKYGCDQKFLAKIIYPKIKKNAYVSTDSVYISGEEVHPLPTPRIGIEFIGRANRDELLDQQNIMISNWISKGCPRIKIPNIYSPTGRLWLMNRKIKSYFKKLF